MIVFFWFFLEGSANKSNTKRRRRKAAVDEKADQELAEISIGQTMLKEMGSLGSRNGKDGQDPKSPKPGKKRTQTPMTLNFEEMLVVSEVMRLI